MQVADIALDIQLGVEAQNRDIEIAVSKRRKYLTMTIEKSGYTPPEYPGPYTVTPTFYYQQRLGTAGKSMAEDVIVENIRVTQMINPQGGKTVVIG